MKHLILLFSVTIIMSCTRSPVNKFINEYNQEDNTVSMTFPGWLVRAGSKGAFKYTNDSDQEGFIKIAKKLGKVRFMTAKNGVIPDGAIKQLIHDAHDYNYEDYVTVRDKSKRFNVMIKQKGETVKGLLLLVSSDEDFVIAHINSDISLSDLEAAQISWNEQRRKDKELAKK